MKRGKPRWKRQQEAVENIESYLGCKLSPKPKSRKKQIMADYHRMQVAATYCKNEETQ